MRTVCINYAWPLFIVFIAGLAAGTLLYVTFFEVLDRDKLGKSHSHGVEEAIAIEEHPAQALQNDHDHH